MKDPNNKTIDPSELSVHPLAKNLPEWGNEDERFLALVEDVKERGIDQRIIITPDNRIVDGRHRWRAAKRIHLAEVPIDVRPETEALGIILNSLLQRRHYSEGARAYLAYPLFKPAMDESKARRLQNLKKGQQTPDLALSAKSGKRVDEFAQMLGVSRRLFDQAKELHELFQKHEGLRAQFEPELLEGEIGLGACIAGIAGQLATKKEKRVDHAQLELFTLGMRTLAHRFSYWNGFDDEQKNAAVPEIRKMVAEMPQDLRKELAKALKAAEKQEQEAA